MVLITGSLNCLSHPSTIGRYYLISVMNPSSTASIMFNFFLLYCSHPQLYVAGGLVILDFHSVGFALIWTVVPLRVYLQHIIFPHITPSWATILSWPWYHRAIYFAQINIFLQNHLLHISPDFDLHNAGITTGCLKKN